MSDASGPEYSFCVPIFNDGALARDFCLAFEDVFRSRLGADAGGGVELIFIDDGSADDSMGALEAVAAEFSFVRVIGLSRNFGQHVALSCGYEAARGAYVGMLNVDMEEPPDQIPLLLEVVERGDADLVVALRPPRRRPWLKSSSSRLFNWLLNKLTGNNVPLNVGTLRVMNRRFIDAYNTLQERSRYLPGLETWLGFSHTYVPIRAQERTAGRSSYTLGPRVRMALDAIISFSDRPLQWVAWLGILLALAGTAVAFVLVALRLLSVDFQPGYVSTIALIMFIGGAQIFVVGVASLYIGRVLREVQGRPLYVVRKRVGFPEEGA